MTEPTPATVDLPRVGDRVQLRVPTEEDVDGLAELADDPEVARWTFVPEPYLRSDAESFVRQARMKIRTEEAYLMAIERLDDGVVVGTFALDRVDRWARRADVGYWLGEPYRGQGLASEALELALSIAFGDLDLIRVQARVFPGNEASIRLLERHGFEREGRLRRHVRHRGEFRDEMIYGRLREDVDRDGPSHSGSVR